MHTFIYSANQLFPSLPGEPALLISVATQHLTLLGVRSQMCDENILTFYFWCHNQDLSLKVSSRTLALRAARRKIKHSRKPPLQRVNWSVLAFNRTGSAPLLLHRVWSGCWFLGVNKHSQEPRVSGGLQVLMKMELSGRTWAHRRLVKDSAAVITSQWLSTQLYWWEEGGENPLWAWALSPALPLPCWPCVTGSDISDTIERDKEIWQAGVKGFSSPCCLFLSVFISFLLSSHSSPCLSQSNLTPLSVTPFLSLPPPSVLPSVSIHCTRLSWVHYPLQKNGMDLNDSTGGLCSNSANGNTHSDTVGYVAAMLTVASRCVAEGNVAPALMVA